MTQTGFWSQQWLRSWSQWTSLLARHKGWRKTRVEVFSSKTMSTGSIPMNWNKRVRQNKRRHHLLSLGPSHPISFLPWGQTLDTRQADLPCLGGRRWMLLKSFYLTQSAASYSTPLYLRCLKLISNILIPKCQMERWILKTLKTIEQREKWKSKVLLF